MERPHHAWLLVKERLGDGRDVLGRVAATPPRDVHEVGVGELGKVARHIGRLEVEPGRRERVGQAGVRIAGDRRVGLLRELGQERVHEVGAERAVEADREGFYVPHRVPQRLDGLRRDHRLAAAPDRRRHHHRERHAVLLEHLLDRDERRLGVERIEDRLDEEHVGAPRDERSHLARVGRFHLVEGDDAEAGIVGIGRIRERHRERADGAGDEAALSVGGAHAIGPFTAFARRLDVDLPREVVQERAGEDGVVERGVLPPPVLARIVDEELALPDVRGAEGVRLDDVGSRLEEATVDVADHLRLREREEVAVVQQVLLGVGKAAPADVRLLHVVGANRRAHRAVDDGDALLEESLERVNHVAHDRARLSMDERGNHVPSVLESAAPRFDYAARLSASLAWRSFLIFCFARASI